MGRCLGLNPTLSELETMVNEVDVNGDGVIDFEEEFLPLMSAKLEDVVEEEELLAVFREWDSENTGLISAVDMRHAMTTIGECLSDDEVDEMIRTANVDADGMVDYVDLVKLMMAEH